MTRVVQGEDWTDAEIQRFWDHEASRTDGGDANYFSRMQAPAIAHWLVLHGVTMGDVLDFGCGPGDLLAVLQPMSRSVSGVDSSPRSIEAARQRCESRVTPTQFAVLDPSQPWPLARTDFDLITCIETLEHLRPSQARQVLLLLASHLKPGGHLLVTVPHAEALAAQMVYCPFCDTQFHRWQHLRSISLAEMQSDLVAAELEPVSLSAIDLREYLPELSTKHNPRQANWRRRAAWRAVPILQSLAPEVARRLENRLRTHAGHNLVALARKPAS